MTDKQMRKTVRSFINNNDIKELSFAELKRVLKQQGFTLVRYSHHGNTPEVDTILASLNLSKYALSVKAFTYVDGSNRLIFLVENLSDREAVILLAHEEGHIVLDCVGNGKVFGDDIENEYAANEFAHHLIKRFKNKSLSQIQQRKKPLIVFISVLAVLVVGMLAFTFFNGRSTGEDIYYVTSTGKKYHAKDCKYIEGKKNLTALTKDECIRQGYEPCDVCVSDLAANDLSALVTSDTDVSDTTAVTTGVVKGNITWQYNDYVGTKADVGSVIFLFPIDMPKGLFTNAQALGIYSAPIPEGCFKARVDGMGEYYIDEVPVGDYVLWVISENTSPSPKMAVASFDYINKYFSDDLLENLKSFLEFNDCAFEEMTVSEGDNVFSYDFGNTYY